MRGSNAVQPVVSVIIPTLNSGKFLALCLESLKRQTWTAMEVIVVDDGSTDSTVRTAKERGCKVIENPKRGRAEAKNEGIRRSHGKYILFVDSDMELTEDVTDECVELAEKNQRVGGIVIPERSVGCSFWVKARDFERSFYAGSATESARFFPTELARDVGGFEEGVIFFEESTLPCKIQRKGFNVSARVESFILHHEEDFSLANWLRKKFYYGESIESYKRNYGGYFQAQTSLWSRIGLFLREWRRFSGRPRLAFGIILLKSLEYFATTSGSVYHALKS
jgi:glycosyltransferase involved in cell wall biosynthesis